jgi:hypothetical protein
MGGKDSKPKHDESASPSCEIKQSPAFLKLVRGFQRLLIKEKVFSFCFVSFFVLIFLLVLSQPCLIIPSIKRSDLSDLKLVGQGGSKLVYRCKLNLSALPTEEKTKIDSTKKESKEEKSDKNTTQKESKEEKSKKSKEEDEDSAMSACYYCYLKSELLEKKDNNSDEVKKEFEQEFSALSDPKLQAHPYILKVLAVCVFRWFSSVLVTSYEFFFSDCYIVSCSLSLVVLAACV